MKVILPLLMTPFSASPCKFSLCFHSFLCYCFSGSFAPSVFNSIISSTFPPFLLLAFAQLSLSLFISLLVAFVRPTNTLSTFLWITMNKQANKTNFPGLYNLFRLLSSWFPFQGKSVCSWTSWKLLSQRPPMTSNQQIQWTVLLFTLSYSF